MIPQFVSDWVAKYPTFSLLLVFALIVGSVFLIVGFSAEFTTTDKNNDGAITLNEIGFAKGSAKIKPKDFQQWLPIATGGVMFLLGSMLAVARHKVTTPLKPN